MTGIAPTEIRLLCFRLGEALWAVDLMRIREVVPLRGIAPAGDDAPFVAGTIHLRNDHIPVMELARRFGLRREGGDGPGELIVVRLPGTLLALAVDRVLEVVGVPVERILPPEDADGAGGDFVLGVCRCNAEQTMILDIDLLHAATPLCRGGGVRERR